jgi:hypothetical protein
MATRAVETATDTCHPAASSGSPTAEAVSLLFANANPHRPSRHYCTYEQEFPGFQVGKKEDKLGCDPPRRAS